jgi:hypothetical protein
MATVRLSGPAKPSWAVVIKWLSKVSIIWRKKVAEEALTKVVEN